MCFAPTVSLDLAPSEYHLFQVLQNSLNEKSFTDQADVITYLNQFFASKSQMFYEKGIMKSERWEQFINKNAGFILCMKKNYVLFYVSFHPSKTERSYGPT